MLHSYSLDCYTEQENKVKKIELSYKIWYYHTTPCKESQTVIQFCSNASTERLGPIPSLKKLRQDQESKSDNI